MTGSGQKLYVRAKQRIPGGTQLLSKRPEMFLPDQWPSYYDRAQGVEVWDLDGNKYIDMSHNGIGACILGAADPDVDSAVLEAVRRGSMSTLNCPEEVELAELLCELHPWADMVRYARTGGEAMAMAVRIARAHTHRDKIAFCGYHGWHDWFLAANLAEDDALDGHLLPGLNPKGVPRSLQGTAIPFQYNHIDQLHTIIRAHPGEIAAIVMEPIRGEQPLAGFLEEVRNFATEIGAVLIYDECSSGFRLNSGGVHLLFGIDPDIVMFAKALSNGYPMAAVLGRGEIMSAAQSTFISSTYWTERLGPVAALATIRKHRRCNVAAHLMRIGEAVQAGWQIAGERAGLPILVGGIKPLSHFAIDLPEGQAARTLFTQMMLEHNFLAGGNFYATYAHQDVHIESYLSAVEQVFAVIYQAVEDGSLHEYLDGPIAHSGFRRLVS